MSVIRSFWHGWRVAATLWPVVLLAYLVDTAMAALAAIPPVTQLAGIFGHSSMAPELLGPVSLDWLVETTGTGDGRPFPWLLYLVVPLLYLLLVTFLRGGLLGSLVEDAADFSWPDFFADCARLFWRLLLLTLFYLPGFIALFLIFLLLSLPLAAAESAGLPSAVVTGLRVGLALLLFLLLMAALDYARVSLALEPRRSLWRHAARGFWFSLRRIYLVAPLAIAFALVAALFAAAYPALLWAFPAVNDLWLALLVQQLSMLALNWQRVATLGGEMALYRNR
jgi:hypothetical protein